MKAKLLLLSTLFLMSTVLVIAQSTEKRDVGSFSELQIGGVFDVQLTQGNTESVEIEAKESVLPDIITKKEGDRLIVKMREKKNYKNLKKIKIYITFKELDYLENSGVGNLRSASPLKFKNLEFKNSSVGNVELNIEANDINAEITSVGNTVLSGRADKMYLRNKSVGNLRASDLKVNELTIKNNSVGNTEVYAEQVISINNSGIGSLKYSGNATIKEMNSSGIGRVKKM